MDGTSFYYNGVSKGTVTNSRKTFTAIGGKIIIAPDMKYYDTVSGTFGSLGSKKRTFTGSITDGTIYGESAVLNTIKCTGVTWSDYFKEGDAISMYNQGGASGPFSTELTLVIREIDGNELHFYENSFPDYATWSITKSGNDSTGPGVCFERKVPALTCMCENENRLWGCADGTIYASKLGDPFNFYVYDGLETDSWTVDTGSPGAFTGCISYLGYPTFFKERNIYKVYGSIPSNFEVIGAATLGIAAGSAASLAVAGETLFYHNRAGICMFTGGMPQPVTMAFGDRRYKNASGGSDGLKYWVSMQDESDAWHLFVYDTQRGMWHEEDDTQATHFAWSEGNLYYLDGEGRIRITGTITEAPAGTTDEAAFDWWAEFTDATQGSPYKKGLSKLYVRAELETGASLTVKLQVDSSGKWITPNGGTIREATKRSYILAIVPQRADHYRIRLEGHGGCRVYSIAWDSYQGSEDKSQQGRQ